MRFSNSKLRSGLLFLALISVGFLASACVVMHAQGLVGAPADHIYGQSAGGNQADYDTARDMSLAATAVSGIFSVIAMSLYRWKTKGRGFRKIAISSIILLGLRLHRLYASAFCWQILFKQRIVRRLLSLRII